MIFTFRFISNEEESFIIDININHDQTFEQLHNTIQKTLGYDTKQLASFFTSNNSWEKIHEITFVDMGNNESVRTMSKTNIDSFITEKDQRILYIFDYFNERLFFGSIVRTIDADSPIELPSISKFEGTIPPQFKKDDIADDMIYDLDDLNEDEDDISFEELPDDFDHYDPNDY